MTHPKHSSNAQHARSLNRIKKYMTKLGEIKCRDKSDLLLRIDQLNEEQ